MRSRKNGWEVGGQAGERGVKEAKACIQLC